MASWVDEYHETAVFELETVLTPNYKPVVSSARYLPLIAEDGDCHFVVDEDAFYLFDSGTWFRIM